MKKYSKYRIALGFAVALNVLNVLGIMPWASVIDKTTGRRVYQLTDRPGNNMAFYYLFKNQGKVGDVPYLVYRNSFSKPGSAGGITYYSLNLNTGKEVELTRRGMVGSIADVQGEYMYCMEKKKKSDRFYSYVNRSHLATGTQKRIFNLNTKYKHSANITVNADGTKVLFFRPEGKGIILLCGIIADGTQHVIASGHMSHIQFGPVDPDLYLYINEDYVLQWKRMGFGWVDFAGGFVTNILLNSADPFFRESNGNLIPSHLHWDADGVPAITAVDTLKPYVKEYNIIISPDRKKLGEVLKYRKVQIKMGEFQTHFNPGPSPDEFVGDGKSADWWHKPGFGKPYIHKVHYDYTTEKMTQIPLANQIGSFWKSGEYEACARYVPGKDIVVWNAFRTLEGDVPEYPTGGKEGDESWLYCSENDVKQNVFAVSFASEDAAGWDFSADAEGWTASNMTEFGWSDGGFDAACIQGKIRKKDAVIFSPDQINLSCANYSGLMIRLKNESSSTLCRIYFTTDKSPYFSEDKMVEVKIGSKMKKYNSFFVDLSSNSNWHGTLKQLKVYPGYGASEGQFSIQVIIVVTATQVVNGLNKKKTDKPIQSPVKKNVVTPTQKILVDDDIWPYFNWAAFDQDKIVSYGNYQYSIYWDADTVLVVVRRDLKNNSIQTLRFPKYKLTVNPKDGHRNTVIGISPKDGRLHFSWDHHCSNLHYTKSRKGFLTNPPAKISIADFETAQPLAPGSPQIVTYPRFFNDANDNLFFVYRTGWSGFGDLIISSYNSKKGKWNVIGCFLGQEGTFKPWHNSTNRNAYLHDVLFDKNNRLHITWLYREEAAGYGNNHDLYYAYSNDSGVTWMNNDGKEIADLSKKDPILISDPGIIIEKIPVYSWFINQCAMTIDSKNCPHVAIYKLPTPQKSPTISPPPNLKKQQCFYHYWRDTNEKWHSSGPINVPPGLSIGRPNIVVDSNDNVIIYWVSNKGLCYYLAKADENWKKWTLGSLTDESFTCNDSPKHDRRLLKNKGILSFTVNPKGKEAGHGYAILDFNIKDLVYPEKEVAKK